MAAILSDARSRAEWLMRSMQSRGIRFKVDADGGLSASPRHKITREDAHAIRLHKSEIGKIISETGSAPLPHPPGEPYPVVLGFEEFDPHHTAEDIAAGNWGREFLPGYHCDPRQSTHEHPTTPHRPKPK